MRNLLLIDADDTLWENNIYFERATHDFITFLNHSTLSADEIHRILDGVERMMGYGSVNYTKSLVETYRRVAENEVTDEGLEQVQRFGARIVEEPMELLEGVQDTLDYLYPCHDLMLLTKGAIEEQKLKVERSGIEKYFAQVLIVSEKNVAAYEKIIAELQAEPTMTWMVGNSPRSDINPALAAGLNAVFVPHPHTWRLEHEEVVNAGKGQLLQIERFSDLRQYF